MKGKNAVGAGYSAPAAKSTIGGKGASAPDSAGVGYGLSERSDIGSQSGTAAVSSDGSHPGFATERLKQRSTKSVSSKGKTFQVEG